jgi:putative flippase GtrA
MDRNEDGSGEVTMKKFLAFVLFHYTALPPLHQQIVRFLLTGGMNSVFAYAMYALGARGLNLPYLAAQVFAWVMGVCFSFATFRAFVFTGGDRSFRAFARFLPTYVVLLCVSLAMMHVLVGMWGWNDLIAQLVVIPTCAVLSFIFNRLFVFKEKKG